MSRRIALFIFIVGLTATFFIKPQAKSNEVQGMANFTVVTRTSTPKPVPPTATKKSGGGGGNNNPTKEAATAVPENTPTPTLIPITLVATPVGGFIPTAVSCGFPPTVQAQNTTRIRLGPGIDYDIIGQLVYLETRPIVGRAPDSEWWVIQFSNNQTGWISNEVVNIHGNISGIPIVAASPLNGVEPTPGTAWNPTPNPSCPTVTPSATPTATEIAPSTETPSPTETTPAEILEEPPEVTEEPVVTITSVVPAGSETTEAMAALDESPEPTATAVPLDTEDTASAASALPCSPALIGLAIIGFLAFRRIF